MTVAGIRLPAIFRLRNLHRTKASNHNEFENESHTIWSDPHPFILNLVD